MRPSGKTLSVSATDVRLRSLIISLARKRFGGFLKVYSKASNGTERTIKTLLLLWVSLAVIGN